MPSKTNKTMKRELIPKACEIPGCGYDYFVTRHRIKQGKIGGKYIPGNVIGLCPNHHIEADNGKIRQYELFQLVFARLKQTLESRDSNRYSEWSGTRTVQQDRFTHISYSPVGANGARGSLPGD